MTLDRRATDPLEVGTLHEFRFDYNEDGPWTVTVVTERHPEPRRQMFVRRILAAVSTGAVLYGAHASVWAIPMLLGAVAAAALFIVWQPQDRLRRLVRVWR